MPHALNLVHMAMQNAMARVHKPVQLKQKPKPLSQILKRTIIDIIKSIIGQSVNL